MDRFVMSSKTSDSFALSRRSTILAASQNITKSPPKQTKRTQTDHFVRKVATKSYFISRVEQPFQISKSQLSKFCNIFSSSLSHTLLVPVVMKILGKGFHFHGIICHLKVTKYFMTQKAPTLLQYKEPSLTCKLFPLLFIRSF